LLLTAVGTLGVSGFGHVEWDAVELPSQFMENYCWEWDVLSHMTQHVDTGAPLPRALFEKMIAAKNFQAGMTTVRQMEFALFDMRLHSEKHTVNRETLLRVLTEVRDEVAVLKPPAFNRMPWSFAHIFSGGYAAGYYSYKWAEVLSADAFSRFEEEGVLSAKAGDDFRREVLGRGGSRDAMTNFVAFRGREPTVDALLRHNGMVSDSAPQH
jgi:oligopeptidase A